MLIGFIKRNYTSSKLKDFFSIITVREFETGYILKLPNFKENKKKKVMRKLLKKIRKLRIDTVVFSKSLKEEEKQLEEIFYENKILNTRGKMLMEYMSFEILEYILKFQGRNMKQEALYILINREQFFNLSFLQQFIDNFKTVNIITNDLSKFKDLQNKLYEEESILISVSNNKKKSLKKAQYILNYNFSEEQIQKYRINRNAIIINIKESIENAIRGFEGIVINEIEIDFTDELLEKYEEVMGNSEFQISRIYESHLCHEFKNNLEIKNNMKYLLKTKPEILKECLNRDEIEIRELKGINGKINKEELIKNSEVNQSLKN